MITAASTVVGKVGIDEQRLLVADLREIIRAAPLFVPVAGSLDMSVEITNAGAVGWCATNDDRKRFPAAKRAGYHYAERHPVTGAPWPAIPPRWIEIADRFRDPGGLHLSWDVAHIVRYAPGAVLGWHRDKTEADLRGEVITLALGDSALWEIEDAEGVVTSEVLVTGDVVRLAGESRSLQHRVARVLPGDTGDMFNPSPLAKPGRVVISMRSGARRAA
jgi:alkylated DNA repair protein (DNA oxidative demethylase)